MNMPAVFRRYKGKKENMGFVVLAAICIAVVCLGRKIPRILISAQRHPVVGIAGGIAVMVGAALVLRTTIDNASSGAPVAGPTPQAARAADVQTHRPMGQALRNLFPFMSTDDDRN
ncbi:hypothetical protein [Burkholderia gladioli]|uniref:hypothetical protein n=1 Tax=Burkholderia gladioli TaxID=28095 RepID=UPI00163FB38B|nr:hypothetical protein [Burkholderia gladioli]